MHQLKWTIIFLNIFTALSISFLLDIPLPERFFFWQHFLKNYYQWSLLGNFIIFNIIIPKSTFIILSRQTIYVLQYTFNFTIIFSNSSPNFFSCRLVDPSRQSNISLCCDNIYCSLIQPHQNLSLTVKAFCNSNFHYDCYFAPAFNHWYIIIRNIFLQTKWITNSKT